MRDVFVAAREQAWHVNRRKGRREPKKGSDLAAAGKNPAPASPSSCIRAVSSMQQAIWWIRQMDFRALQ